MAVLMPRRTPVNNADESFFKALGSRIMQARKGLGLTQQQMADQLGIPQQTYANYEIAHTRLPASLLPVIAPMLGLTPNDLLGQDAFPRKAKRGPVSRLDRQFDSIRQLPRSDQEIVIRMLDAFIAQASREARPA